MRTGQSQCKTHPRAPHTPSLGIVGCCPGPQTEIQGAKCEFVFVPRGLSC